MSRIKDDSYRLSLRYQYAFELSDADYLILMHNDVIFKNNIITSFIENIGEHIAIGEIGQCWNCPLNREDIVRIISTNSEITPCNRKMYDRFRCNYNELSKAYEYAQMKNYQLRYKAQDALTDEYKINPWPFPECRVNEWCCMINMIKSRKATIPLGDGRPFGAYLKGHDLGCAWFIASL